MWITLSWYQITHYLYLALVDGMSFELLMLGTIGWCSPGTLAKLRFEIPTRNLRGTVVLELVMVDIVVVEAVLDGWFGGWIDCVSFVAGTELIDSSISKSIVSIGSSSIGLFLMLLLVGSCWIFVIDVSVVVLIDWWLDAVDCGICSVWTWVLIVELGSWWCWLSTIVLGMCDCGDVVVFVGSTNVLDKCMADVLWSIVSCVMMLVEDVDIDVCDADKDGCIRGADNPGGRFAIGRSRFLPSRLSLDWLTLV